MAPVLRMVLAAATVLVVGVSAANAVVYNVLEETGDGTRDFKKIGTINPFDATSQTAEQFYSFNTPIEFSYNGGPPPPRDDEAISFLVRTSDGLSFVTVFDAPQTTTTNPPDGTAEANLATTDDGVALQVADAPGEFIQTGPYPGYATFYGRWQWWECCTDGLMVGPFTDPTWSLLLDLLSTTGLTSWTVLSNGGADVPMTDILSGRAMKISAVPMPAGMLLLVTAFAVAGAARRFRRRS